MAKSYLTFCVSLCHVVGVFSDLDDVIHILTQFGDQLFEQHVKNDLGFTISYERKPFEPSKEHSFYYRSTNENRTTNLYSVKSSYNVLQHENLYEYAFENRSRQYIEELKQKNHFMNETESLIHDDY